MLDLVRLSDLLGARLTSDAGADLGRVRDLEVATDERVPGVTAIITRDGRVASEALAAPEPGHLIVRCAATGAPEPDRLLLARDVLDAQVVDLSGRRMARVADVDIAFRDGEARAVAVDVGMAAVLRRLGFRRAAARIRDDPLEWEGLYLASGAGHRLQLRRLAADVHRLTPDELHAVVERLPPHRGAQVLAVLQPGEHADPVAAARAAAPPRRRFRVMRARRRAPS